MPWRRWPCPSQQTQRPASFIPTESSRSCGFTTRLFTLHANFETLQRGDYASLPAKTHNTEQNLQSTSLQPHSKRLTSTCPILSGHCLRGSSQSAGHEAVLKWSLRSRLTLEVMASNSIAMASNQIAMASNLIAMASNLIAMASNIMAMASNLITRNGLQPNSDGLQTRDLKNKRMLQHVRELDVQRFLRRESDYSLSQCIQTTVVLFVILSYFDLCPFRSATWGTFMVHLRVLQPDVTLLFPNMPDLLLLSLPKDGDESVIEDLANFCYNCQGAARI